MRQRKLLIGLKLPIENAADWSDLAEAEVSVQTGDLPPQQWSEWRNTWSHGLAET